MKDTRAERVENPQPALEQPKTTSHAMRQNLVRMWGGVSPVSTLAMVNEWALHLAAAPDTQMALAHQAQQNWVDWLSYVAKGCPDDASQRPITPRKGDRRFAHEGWSKPPFAAWAQAFLLAEDLAERAATDVPGVPAAQSRAMAFMMRQMLDAVAPSNFLSTNPEVLERTRDQQGHNLIKGAEAFQRDVQKLLTHEKSDPTAAVGKQVATTKGNVVFRNHLIELIQYEPTTDTVHPEPVLLMPAWIMKYYILDLSPENSMVQYLTEQGFTVFAVSWRNPGAEDADIGMADYLEQGPFAALDHISQAFGASKIHALGYCLGGTLMSIAAAKLARDGDDRLASLTLLAAQTDFSEAGELMLFINESKLSFLEEVMATQGYLEADQMMSAFQMMRSNDLIWSQAIRTYLLGEDAPKLNDLMAWNADTTRMPARMHSEYLRQIYVQNDIAGGRYKVDGHAVSLRDIRIPLFVVGTETDHIAPWPSVYKIHGLTHAEVTFALTNGGHNAGVLSEPGHARRHFRLHTTKDTDTALTPEDWLDAVPATEGSWWPAWSDWLAARSGDRTAPPAMSGDLAKAPGQYVMMK